MRLNIYLACGHSVEGTKADGRQIAILQSEGKQAFARCTSGCGKQEVKAKKAQRTSPPPRAPRRR